MKPISSENKDGMLHIGGLSCKDLLSTYGSPLYVLDQATLSANCQAYLKPLQERQLEHTVIYASKANLSVGLAKKLLAEGMGFDVVSAGELFTVLKAGAAPENIYFHGNNKSDEELEMALKNAVCIVVDNDEEFHQIGHIAKVLDVTANILFRIKPEIDAHTHEFIRTGQLDSKFGLQKNDTLHYVKLATEHSHLNFLGLHAHIGSQTFDIKPFEALVERMVTEVTVIKDRLGIECETLNLGGGLGIQYIESEDPQKLDLAVGHLADLYIKGFSAKGLKAPKLILEPGRSIVATAGVTLYTIGARKSIPGIRDYLFVDGGMADNPRPILYQADYTMELANKLNETKENTYTIAGKFCESGDILAKDKALPKAEKGDIFVVYGTGAYNYSMASNYNRSGKLPTVCVGEGKAELLVRRESLDDLLHLDVV